MLRYVLKILYRRLVDTYKAWMGEPRFLMLGAYDYKRLNMTMEKTDPRKNLLQQKLFAESSVYKMETRETLFEYVIKTYFQYMDEFDFLLFLMFPIAVTSLLIRFYMRFMCSNKKG